MEEVVIKKKASSTWKPSQRSLNLLATRGHQKGTTLDWGYVNDVTLSEQEKQALKRKHKTSTPNLVRAADVKRLMLEEKRCVEIVAALRGIYGERMIKADHATLSAIGEGLKKHR